MARVIAEGSFMMRWRRLGLSVLAGTAAVVASHNHEAEAFSQSSPVTPPGHERITVKGAEMSGLAQLNPEGSEIGYANNCIDSACDTHSTNSDRVWSAVIGQRWTDLMGFYKVEQSKCFDAVAQNNEDVQYDHFLRKTRDDKFGAGASNAYQGSVARFKWLFLQAVAADDSLILAQDGGGTQLTVHVKKAYFMFGRAVHILEDSFSPEHVTRDPKTGMILDVLSYTTTPDASYHTHDSPFWGKKTDADVIFTNGYGGTLNAPAVMAVSAMSDLWNAFEQAHARPTDTNNATTQLNAFVSKWFVVDPNLGNARGKVPSTDGRDRSGGDFKAVVPDGTITSWRNQCLDFTSRQTEPVPPGSPPGVQPLVIPPFAWSADFHDWNIGDPGGTPRDWQRFGLDLVTGLMAFADYVIHGFSQELANIKADLTDAAITADHLTHSHSDCFPAHVDAYATAHAQDAISRAQARVDNFWANLVSQLSVVTDPQAKFDMANAAVARMKTQLLTDPEFGLNAYVTDRSSYVREWFFTGTNQDHAESEARQTMQALVSAFATKMDSDFAAKVPKPKAPPAPFYVLAPTSAVETFEGRTTSIILSKGGTVAPLDPEDGVLSGSGTSFVYTAPSAIARRHVVTLVFTPADQTVGQLVSIPVSLRTSLHLESSVAGGAWTAGCPATIGDGQQIAFRIHETTSNVTWAPLGPSDEVAPTSTGIVVTGKSHTNVHFYPPNGRVPATPPPQTVVTATAPDGRFGACTVREPGVSVAFTDTATANVSVKAGSKVSFYIHNARGQVSDPMPDWTVAGDGMMGASAKEKAVIDQRLSSLRQLQSLTSMSPQASSKLQAGAMTKQGGLAMTELGSVKGAALKATQANKAQAAQLAGDVQQHAGSVSAALSYSSAANGMFAGGTAGRTATIAGKAKDGSGRSFSARVTTTQ
jgi:hypothetical protein